MFLRLGNMYSQKFSFTEIPSGNQHLKCRRFMFHEHLDGRIMADGHVDFLMIVSGEAFWLGPGQKKFVPLAPLTAFPLGQSWSCFHINSGTQLINLKVRPDLLKADLMRNLTGNQPIDLQKVMLPEVFDRLKMVFEEALLNGDLNTLFSFIVEKNGNTRQSLSESFNIILEACAAETDLFSPISEIFLKRGHAYKKIARDFKQTTGFPLKRYFDTLRFHRAIHAIRSQSDQLHGNLIEALRYGYYDQSHFVKWSRSISGLNPSMLIKHLPQGASDFLVS